jgi:selenocysteine lyase/cysteine desulfurase
LEYDQPFASNATRFEGGTPNFIGALSLAESIDVIEQAGTERIASHVLALTDRLVEGLRSADAEIATTRSQSASSGIVTFRPRSGDPVELGKALQHEGIVTTYRASGVRVAPHGYNTFEEIDALVESVVRYGKERLCSR